MNAAPGKPAGLFVFRGPGTKEARRLLWRDQDGQVSVGSALLGSFSLAAVHSYQHLGSVMDDKGSMMPEIDCRAKSTAEALQILRRKVCSVKGMTTRVKTLLTTVWCSLGVRTTAALGRRSARPNKVSVTVKS